MNLKNCKFKNNTSQSGGAIYLNWDIRLIDKTEFEGNTAIDEYTENAEAPGGAIMYG